MHMTFENRLQLNQALSTLKGNSNSFDIARVRYSKRTNYSKFLNGRHFSSAVSTRHLHVIGVSPRLSLAKRKSNVVATQRTSLPSNVGSEARPIRKVAITTGHVHAVKKCLPI